MSVFLGEEVRLQLKKRMREEKQRSQWRGGLLRWERERWERSDGWRPGRLLLTPASSGPHGDKGARCPRTTLGRGRDLGAKQTVVRPSMEGAVWKQIINRDPEHLLGS